MMKTMLLLLGMIIFEIFIYIFFEYFNLSNLSTPISLVLYSSFLFLIIIFTIEHKKVAYVLLYFSTYAVTAPTFAMEVLLFNENPSLKSQWFKSRYTYKTFKIEFYLFWPAIFILYLLIFSYGASRVSFSSKEILNKMKILLD